MRIYKAKKENKDILCSDKVIQKKEGNICSSVTYYVYVDSDYKEVELRLRNNILLHEPDFLLKEKESPTIFQEVIIYKNA